MNLPDFIIIGAQKAATTSLYYYLAQHKDIYFPAIKEPSFFYFYETGKVISDDTPVLKLVKREHLVTNLNQYSALFNGANKGQIKGEASTGYLSSPDAPHSIKRILPDVKIIAILRHPVERAFSHYQMFLSNGIENNYNFDDVIRSNNERLVNNEYIWNGMYCKHLKVYFDLFEKDQIKVYLYDDLKKNPKGVVEDMLLFLGVEPIVDGMNFEQVHNQAGPIYNNKRLRVLGDWLNSKSRILPLPIRWRVNKYLSLLEQANRVSVSMSPSARRHLIEIYKSDVLCLEKLLHRDLSSWQQ